MSGLVKAKKYDWKDSNLALFGSDTEKEVKKSSAESEPAWKPAGKQPGVQIWRVVKFKIEAWPVESYGQFYSGDSYIILNTYKEKDSEELNYDVHFWIGQHSTQDEYGTAAYKTVELDTLLDDKPIQHREVQGHESQIFKSYFKNMTYLKGGADTGFRHVKPEEYVPRVLRVTKTGRKIQAKEVKIRSVDDVTSDDVFILDKGLEIFLWKGSSCSKDETFKATQMVQAMRSERGGKPQTETVEEVFEGKTVFERFLKEQDDDDDDDDDSAYEDEDNKPELFRLTDSDGSIDFEVTCDEHITKSDFKEEDVFILDTKKDVFVWVGRRASANEKKNAMTYAHNYLMKTSHPLIPVTCLKSGKENKEFISALAA